MKPCNNCPNQIDEDMDYCHICIKRVLVNGSKRVKINIRGVIENGR